MRLDSIFCHFHIYSLTVAKEQKKNEHSFALIVTGYCYRLYCVQHIQKLRVAFFQAEIQSNIQLNFSNIQNLLVQLICNANLSIS